MDRVKQRPSTPVSLRDGRPNVLVFRDQNYSHLTHLIMVCAITRRRMAAVPLCVLILAGCAGHAAQQPAQPAQPAQPEMKPAPATPIAEKKDELGEQSWDPQWDQIVEQALSPEMLSPSAAREVRSYCPRFAAMSDADKRAFWAYTFQALAGAEAGLKPTTNVRHTEPEVAVRTRLASGRCDRKVCCSLPIWTLPGMAAISTGSTTRLYRKRIPRKPSSNPGTICCVG